ncbi:MAG: hypothetical protein NTW87_28040 [Planctomycetota bacterium]|nr:hypothetical protein [Planctomycetota bacterium]
MRERSWRATGLAIMALLAGFVAQAAEAQPYKEPPGPWSEAARPVTPRAPAAGEIPIDQPGCYAQAGATYILTKDITSPTTAVFLGKDVVLDLNGHTITFADGGYKHIPNYSFEEGEKNWDLTKAANATIKNTRLFFPIVGDYTCQLKEGEEIVSSSIELPLANRAYYGTVAVAQNDMRVDVIMEDAQGKQIDYKFPLGQKRPIASPILNMSPELGGSVIFALLWKQPAGRYRMRIRARTNAVIDDVDIVPALDAGVAVVEQVHPWLDYVNTRGWDPCAFPDYHENKDIPHVQGAGTVTIRNGTIRNGFDGIRSFCIQSSAASVKLVLENLKLINSGVSAFAVQAWGPTDMKRCRVELDVPFTINRHDNRGSVNFGGKVPSTVAGCAFSGGQGCLSGIGDKGEVYDCYFRNKQTVTNNYAIMGGSGNRIHNNYIAPVSGSGIYVAGKNSEVYDNCFEIEGPAPNNEYHHCDYSANAIRISDYNRPSGDPKGCENNRIYRNKFKVRGRSYENTHKNYLSVATAIFTSVGAGPNYIYDNDFDIEVEPRKGSNLEAWAFYASGDQSGQFYNNRVISNFTPVWIGTRYCATKQCDVVGNTFTRKEGAKDFRWFELGNASTVIFGDNKFPGSEFSLNGGSYYTGYTITVKGGAPLAEAVARDKDGKEFKKGRFDENGTWIVRLPEFLVAKQGKEKTDVSASTIESGGKSAKLEVRRDAQVELK